MGCMEFCSWRGSGAAPSPAPNLGFAMQQALHIDGGPHANICAAKVQLWGSPRSSSCGSYGRVHKWDLCPTSLRAPCVCNALCNALQAAPSCTSKGLSRRNCSSVIIRGSGTGKVRQEGNARARPRLHCTALRCTALQGAAHGACSPTRPARVWGSGGDLGCA